MKLSKRMKWLAVVIAIASAAPLVGFGAEKVVSPDGKVVVTFALQTDGTPVYSVTYGGKPRVLESRLGLEPGFTNGFMQFAVETNLHQGQWTNAVGERRIVPDNYRELVVDLMPPLRISIRAYDEGVAFRYDLVKVIFRTREEGVVSESTNEMKFTGERTEFRFPVDTYGYEEHGTEGEYERVKIGEFKPWCERPLTLEFAGGGYAALGEAGNTNFPRMLLSPAPGVADALVSALGGTSANTEAFRQRHDPSISLRAGESSPWRFIVFGDNPGDLLERNYMMLNLNPPSLIADTSWIRPGKVMRDTTLTTTNSKAIIDFAAKGGVQYVLLDARWYGSEEVDTGDATTARAPNLDVQEIIRYGREKGVGLILYVDRRQVQKQRDVIFPLYEKWGVAGVKLGFVNVGPQSETEWISYTITKAAERHLMLNIHDGYRATGNNRTWPNLLTVEGIRGNEHFPTPEHDCTLPFTRYVGGIADYTVCYYDKRLKNTHGHQLAMSVVSFSPLQCLYWYDSPGMSHDEPELEFFRHVATVWDETKVVQGEIGKFATIARRSGNDWFVGTVNNSEARKLPLALNFLERGKEYVAHVYSDDDSVARRTKVGVATRSVNSETALQMTLKPAGGEAVWITPAARD